jgi:DNA-binding NtrC family response regulator
MSTQHKTILCIDDDEGALAYHRALLERRGFDVLTASSARRGLQILDGCPAAAAIVDYNMPEMTGGDVAAELKRQHPEMPVVMLSSDEGIPKIALRTVDAFLSKAAAHSALLPLIFKICEEHRSVPGERPAQVQDIFDGIC